MKSKILKEAIADAKAVRETALANARIALEEAFSPKLQSMLSKKLKEELEAEEEEEDLTTENDVSSEIGKGDNANPAAKAFDTAADSNELGAAGIEKQTAKVGEEDDEVEVVAEGEDEEDITGATPETGLNEEEYGEDEAEEELSEEEEDDLDLEEIIRELEAESDDEVHTEEEEAEVDSFDAAEAPTTEAGEEELPQDAEEEELDLDEILREMGYGDEDEVTEEEEETSDDSTDVVAALQAEVETQETELEEAYSTIKTLRTTINEVNLLNAKLLYVNKLFKAYNLTTEQKNKVLETLDRSKNVREVKLVYTTIAESFRYGSSVSRKSVRKITEGYASKPVKSTAPEKTVIAENTVADRFKKLAGIITK